MSIVILGKTPCVLCGETLRTGQAVESFPAFVWNESDSLSLFSDGAVHLECLNRDPRKERLDEAVAEVLERTGPARRKCVVCSGEITDPDDYLLVPRLTGDSSHPAHRFNYTHLHRSHVPQWREYPEALAAIASLEQDWKGEALRQLVEDLGSSRQA